MSARIEKRFEDPLDAHGGVSVEYWPNMAVPSLVIDTYSGNVCLRGEQILEVAEWIIANAAGVELCDSLDIDRNPDCPLYIYPDEGCVVIETEHQVNRLPHADSKLAGRYLIAAGVRGMEKGKGAANG